MALTRLDNLYSSKTGKYLYVSPDDFNATDELDNRGNSPLRPFKTIQRAFIEVSRYSYLPGKNNDRFDQFTIMLMPGNHFIDNRPGIVNYDGQGNRYFDAANQILTNKDFIAEEAVARMQIAFPSWVSPTGNTSDCTDDVKDTLVELAYNLKFGGNDKVYDAANLYVNGAHVQGEEDQTVAAFNEARDIAIQVMRNEDVAVQGTHGLTQQKNLTISLGPAIAGTSGPNIPYGQSNTCQDVASNITSLIALITTAVGTTGNPGSLSGVTKTAPESDEELPIFNFNRALEEWDDNSILDLSNPDNVLYKFNAASGGAIVPRGCSLIGYDLRRTIIRPLYVPDPTSPSVERTSIFNLTGGCYLWQFTIKDGDLSANSPLYDSTAGVGKVYYIKGNDSAKAIPEYSHHKICIMTYADNADLQSYYDKVGKSFARFQPDIDNGELEALVQENRIVGPLSDTRRIESIKVEDTVAFTGVVTNTNAGITSVNDTSGLEVGATVTTSSTGITIPNNTTIVDITGDVVTLSNPLLGSGGASFSASTGKITATVTTKIDHGYFVDQYVAILNSGLDDQVNGTFKIYSIDADNPKVFQYQIEATTSALGLIDGTTYTTANGLNTNAVGQAEIDSVESASPYVFNCSIRSTWGQCGMWADGSKATGFKSMVVAQYTGVSLQKDDRAFIRYDKFTNTWNQASLTDAFATVPYHAKGDAYWKDDWRNFHIRASDDSFIQCVSVFAVGFFDHFLMESGGDMSITNSNSNFGNTSLHAVGFKGFAFNQDKGGYISDIIPPKTIRESVEEKIQYYTLDIQASNDTTNNTRLYLGSDDLTDPADRPAASISGYRVGARSDDKLYVKLDNGTYYSTLEPTGFLRYTASIETLNPSGIQVDNLAQDAANLIALNKEFIQNEAYTYITTKYPYLLTNPNIVIGKCERDIGYFVDAVVSDLKLGGNINTIQAAEGYFIGGQLTYIQNELDESIETYDYVKNMCIAAMRNWDFLIQNCTVTDTSEIVDVGSTAGLLVGMSVKEYASADFNADSQLIGTPTPITTAIPVNTFIKRILDGSRIELGVAGSKLTTGSVQPAIGDRVGNAYLYFEIVDGAFSTTLDPEKDPTILTSNAGYPECANVATTISGYFDDIFVILNNGLTRLGQKQTDASNLIDGNKELIAEVAVDRMLTNFPGFSVPGGNQEYINDIIDTINAITFNVEYGSNNKVYDIAELYVSDPTLLAGQQDEVVYAYTEARDMMIQAMRNQSITITGSSRSQFIDNNVVVDPTDTTVSTVITNLVSIVTQGVGTSSTPGTLSGITKTTPVITNVTRVEPVLDTENLVKRATIFTVNTGGGVSNPHNFETGTPVRLVPRARAGTNPDKRLIRLPEGFDPNTKYYVIAPGRTTVPEDYSVGASYPGVFDGSDQTKLMLAATKENAAAGIYIYSPETDDLDPDVEIEMQQYILDDIYDLHRYTCNLGGAGEIETDVAHIFDLPNANVTPQKVFFRVATDIIGSGLPSTATGAIDTQTYFYARYVSPKRFSVHTTHADAIAGVNALNFVSSSGQDFYVFADKRRSPLRFDAEFSTSTNTSGLWYLQVKNESTSATPQFRADSILTRFHDPVAYGSGSGKIRTLDTWIDRVKDDRTEGDRVYRLKYVIPKYLETVRNPLNGFVLKVRTDDKRRLVPQRFVLNPVGGAPDVARFDNPAQAGERIGFSRSDLSALGITNPTYDPYNEPKIVASDRTQSRIAFTIQSARTVNNRLEITAFDHTITVDALKNEIFTVVEINAPQGGSFVVSNSTATSANAVEWNGDAAGSGYIQGYFQQGTKHYLVLKNTTKDPKYNALVQTRFTQGSVFADLQAKPNSVGDPTGKDKSDRKDYLYRIEGANVYTVVPGDVITDDQSNQYTIEEVYDVGAIEDTFYIFDIDTIQQRIAGQQDGIYYLTCLRGNISPFPQGAGVGNNFRNFKFSQPISQLYPLNYKNDPVWFKQINENYNDVPATYSAANNYIHGLVTINDAKNSETKELVEDLISQPALTSFSFVSADTLSSPTLNPSGGSNIIQAQNGNATSGSEDRYIPINGDSDFPTDGRLYVELRRPSIARSGNHTFEYLGFGPGNYSTGFPLRQEVVLEDIQDFYAQSKRENGGIVFYTGLNSNGDLYIGNRKVNAITGEETFLERAVLQDSEDDSDDDLGGLVTTFDTPVTFNDRITVEGDAQFNNPVTITMSVGEGPALSIPSIVDTSSVVEDQSISEANTDSISLNKNQIAAAIYKLNPRQILGNEGQDYSIRTHYTTTLGPTNTTPDQGTLFSGTQRVTYGSTQEPAAGDILFKGKEVGLSGSIGWIFANYYSTAATADINTVTSDGTYVTFNLSVGITNASIGITTAGQIVRISGFTSFTNLNGNWTVESASNLGSQNSFRVRPTVAPASGSTYSWVASGGTLEVSQSKWKELGIVGAETLRTNTETWGAYRLGVNTLARATDDGYQTGFVQTETQPVATLDVEGNTYISGKSTAITVAPGVQLKTESKLDNALNVGGDESDLDNLSVLRVATTPRSGGTGNLGRVSINSNQTAFDAADAELYVVGKTLLQGDTTINGSLALFVGDLSTTSTSLSLFNTPTTVTFAQSATDLQIANGTANNGSQTINIGNFNDEQTITIGDAAETSIFRLHRNSQNATLDIASVANSDASYRCDITIGGAFAASSSMTRVKTRGVQLDGDVEVGSGISGGVGKLFSQNNTFELLAASGGPATVDFAMTASALTMGSRGGTTRVRNALEVNARADFDGDVLLRGGLNSGGFDVTRGVFGTTAAAQAIGDAANFNVDLYQAVAIGRTLDTGGNAPMSATDTILRFDSAIATNTISIGDYILLDETIANDKEIVRVVSLINLTDTTDLAGIRVEVERGADGSTARSHQDNLPLIKLIKNEDASFLTVAMTAGDTQLQTAEFGGVINPNDYLRLNGGEFVRVDGSVTSLTSIQTLSVNDGGTTAPVLAFEVESTTGNTYIRGTADVYDTITLHGDTAAGKELVVNNGQAGVDNVTFYVKSENGAIFGQGGLLLGGKDANATTSDYARIRMNGATGNVSIRDGDLYIQKNTGTSSAFNWVTSLAFVNNTGDLTISGEFAANGTGTNHFAGDLEVRGGDFVVQNNPSDVNFAVVNNGTIKIGEVDRYFGPAGQRRWDYYAFSSGLGDEVQSNINYFINATGNLYVRLPQDPKSGDMIRFVDLGGTLKYDLKLIIRAATGQSVQGDVSNISSTTVTGTTHLGGELIVTTPHAAFGLVYAGPLNSDGSASNVPSAQQGWWLIDI